MKYYALLSIVCMPLLATTPEEHGLREISDNFSIKPVKLLTPSRFDITAKYIYANHRNKAVQCSWAFQVYKQHLVAINNLYESSPLKRSINDFTDSFHALLDSIKNNNFDSQQSIIPVDVNDNARDGSHRVGSCIAHNVIPICKVYNYDPPVSYLSADYLKKRGLEQKYLDAMAIEYCKLKKNTYIATVMPAAVGKDKEITEIIDSYGTIVYQKNVLLNQNGSVNFVKHIYEGESWLGNWNDNFAGVRYKARCCFPQDHRKNNPMRVFLFECKNLENAKECKKKLRDLFGLQNHSVHINDTHEQSIGLARILFVDNSIHFLNYAQPKNFRNFHRYLDEYKQWIEKNKINVDDLCIDSGSVLAAYGIRDCGDVDYLHHGYDSIRPPSNHIESHNHCMGNHTKTKDEIIYNPQNYFWYRGVKFASLKVIKDLKQNGGGFQNKQDAASITTILNQ